MFYLCLGHLISYIPKLINMNVGSWSICISSTNNVRIYEIKFANTANHVRCTYGHCLCRYIYTCTILYLTVSKYILIIYCRLISHKLYKLFSITVIFNVFVRVIMYLNCLYITLLNTYMCIIIIILYNKTIKIKVITDRLCLTESRYC